MAATNLLVHPGGSLLAFIYGGWIDQNQAVMTSIGWTRELILVLHDEAKGVGQLIRAVSLLERYPAGMGPKKQTSSNRTLDRDTPRLWPTRHSRYPNWY